MTTPLHHAASTVNGNKMVIETMWKENIQNKLIRLADKHFFSNDSFVLLKLTANLLLKRHFYYNNFIYSKYLLSVFLMEMCPSPGCIQSLKIHSTALKKFSLNNETKSIFINAYDGGSLSNLHFLFNK